MWDEGQCRIFGVDPATFAVSLETVSPLIAPEGMARLKPTIDEFLRGEIKSYQTEFRVFRSDGVMRWCFGTATPTFDAMGRLMRVSGVTIDITERKQAEEKQLLLAREVDHRARNALAVVQSIVRLTKAKSQEAYAKAVEGRIQALAQAHTLLSESRWQGTDVERLLTEELAPYRGVDNARVQIEGPMVFLSPEKSQNFALVLHELATNSAKHGALSAAEGSLTIRWSVAGDKLVLSWEERGGPPVRPPRSQGFGTKIMNASIKRQIGGNVAWDWRPSGLHCTLHIPLTGDRLPDPPRPENLVQLPSGTARRVLLAEDDAIIGVMMRELLSEHGMFVVGPCCSVKEALAAAEGDFDAAFLDVNLGDESIYTVATRLKERDIPFAFVTGYGKESLDGRFDGAPILQKPVTRENLESTLGALLKGDFQRPIAKASPSTLKRA
jgi:PAS domain S-box-containing protein